jgi:transcriptional antiterminator NusG
VRNTPGVTSFVGHGNRPMPLDDSEVKSILKQMEAEAPKVRVSYQVGQTVKITDGPFTDFEGIVDAIDHERGRVRVLVSFFGREAPIELDFLQVTRLVD